MASLQINLDDQQVQAARENGSLLSVLLEATLNQVLQAEMTEHIGAAPGERTSRRTGHRNGTYSRQLTTRVGTIDLEVPRDRAGTFQTALFERYQRSEKALVLSLMDMVVQGVSTRKVKKITETLCGRSFSRSTVSSLAQGLDEQVQAWAERPLEAQRYPFVLADALYVKVRRQGAVRTTAVLLAVGITEEGQREILGLQVTALLSAVVVIEIVFNLPGLGRLALDAVLDRDYTLLQGTVFLMALLVTAINLAIDLTYFILDPRIEYA